MTRIEKRFETLRKTLSKAIWLAIIIVVLAAVGRYVIVKEFDRTPEERPREKPVFNPIPWEEVDDAVAGAMLETRKATESFAEGKIDAWMAELMCRVDTDFLDWYFSYWTQQLLGLEGLWQYGVNYFFESRPTAAERLTEEIQEEFSKRVLRPQIAELELERIVRETAEYYVEQLRNSLNAVPEKYKIPRADWERYLEGVALTAYGTDGNREVPVTLKALVASGAGGAVLLAAKMQVLIGKLSGTVMAKSAGKAASKMAAKTGGKVAAKAGGKFLGTIVGVGVLVWDVWDHNVTVQENRPLLRQAMADYFNELKDILLNDHEAGLMTTFHDLEKQVFQSLQKTQGRLSE